MKIMQKVLAFILISACLFGQMTDIQFERITPADGLIDGVNFLDIYQDRQGFMWFATGDGLSKYDGYTFKNYRSNLIDSTALSQNGVTAIHEDHTGKLWLGTMWGGLNVFDPVTEEFLHFKLNPNKTSLTQAEVILDISPSGSEGLWIATQGGLEYFDFQTKKFSHYKHDPDDSLSLSSNPLRTLHIDHLGMLWVGAGNWFKWQNEQGGLNRFDPETKTFKRYTHDPDDEFSLINNNIVVIKEDRNGILYIGTNGSALHRYDRENDRIERLNEKTKNGPYAPRSETKGGVRGFIHDMDGYYWVGSANGGINRFDLEHGIMQHYSSDPTDNFSLSSDAVIRIYEDRQGTVWISLMRVGLNKVIPSHSRFHPYKPEDLHTVIKDQYIRALFEDSQGHIFISTDQDVIRYDPASGAFQKFSIIPDISVKGISDFYEDSSGQIWFGGMGTDLVKLDLLSGKSKLYKPKEDNNNTDNLDEKSIGTWNVTSISGDAEGILWISSNHAGLVRLDPNMDTFKHYHYDSLNVRSLNHHSIHSTFIDSKNTLWIGSYGGLNRYNRDKDDFESYLEGFFVGALLEDSEGNFWIGTNGQGLILFDREKGDYKQFTKSDGLLSNDIYSIAEDEDGFLWIATPVGLTKLEIETLTFISFTEEDGIVNPFSRGYHAAIKTKKNEMIFGTHKGITVFSPDHFLINQFPPYVAITGLFIDDKPFKQKGTLDSLIELDYNQNDLTFEYVGLHYKNPSRNKYSVKLEPYEKQWQKANHLRRTRYTNLSPGEYIFYVKASSSDGVWNEEGKTITIIINPPLWATWWAYIFYLLIIIGILYFTRQFELNRRREKENKRFLEAENKRKSEELEEARQLQLSMLPKELPKFSTLDIAVYMQTATEVGGDYYDFSIKSDGSINIAIGDATGHGLKAGTMVSSLKSIFTTNSAKMDLEEFFITANQGVKSMNLKRMMMGFSMLNINDHHFQLINAGMPPVFLFCHKSQSVEEIQEHGIPIGAMNQTQFSTRKGSLEKGDVILLMSDGMPELQNENGEMYGYERIRDNFKKIAKKEPEEIISYLKDEGSAWVNDKDPDDDVTFVVIKVR